MYWIDEPERFEYLMSLLQEVETAINELITNRVKSYSIGQRHFTYLDLDELRNWRREILEELGGIRHLSTNYLTNTTEDGSEI